MADNIHDSYESRFCVNYMAKGADLSLQAFFDEGALDSSKRETFCQASKIPTTPRPVQGVYLEAAVD